MQKVLSISLILTGIIVVLFLLADVAFPETISSIEIPAETIVKGIN